MQTIQPSQIIGRAFEIYREHAGVLIAAALALLAIDVVATLVLDAGLLAVLAALISLIVRTFYTGMVVRLVDDVRDGVRDTAVSDLFASVAPVVVPLLLTSLLIAIGVAIGFLLLIVPGLFLLTIWAVAGPVVVLERKNPIAALGRSRALVSGNGWPVFGTVVFVFVLTFGASLLVAGIVGASGVVSVIVHWVVSALLAPISALVAALLYFALREEPA